VKPIGRLANTDSRTVPGASEVHAHVLDIQVLLEALAPPFPPVAGSLYPAERRLHPAQRAVVDGDPLEDPEVLLDADRIWLVVQSGRPVAGAALETELAALGAAAPGADPVPALAGRPLS
jgi:hypothetical protein